MRLSQGFKTPVSDPGAATPDELRRIDRVLVQGKSQPVILHEVLDAASPAARAARRTTREDFAEGFTPYAAQDFAGALRCFAAVIAREPADSVAEFLLARTRQVRETESADGSNISRVAKPS